MANDGGTRRERAASTHAKLVSAARELFAERGYHDTSTPEVVARAGVTRGALYHHFRDKEALFETVFHQLERELRELSAAEVSDLASDRFRQLQEGVQSFLRVVAMRADIQQILLIDAPSVFGWRRWREMGADSILGDIGDAFRDLIRDGVIRPQPVLPLAHLVLAALTEASMMIAHSVDPEATRIEVSDALRNLIAGLR
ncbi:TetR/AcrR family transcriptional regulator [Sphingopyxis lindanitolerans]|nr:TetR/AcrR family transcriptional regulator [Sphingopyxis lindanitolerans]